MATVSSKIKKAVDDATETNPDLQAQVAALKEDIASIAATLAQIGKNSTKEARANAANSFETAKLRGEEVFEDLKSQALDIEDHLTETIRDKPLTSIAVAAGVGFLLALISRR